MANHCLLWRWWWWWRQRCPPLFLRGCTNALHTAGAVRLVRAAKVGDFLPHALGGVAVGQEGAWEAGILPVDQDTPCHQDSSIFTLETALFDLESDKQFAMRTTTTLVLVSISTKTVTLLLSQLKD